MCRLVYLLLVLSLIACKDRSAAKANSPKNISTATVFRKLTEPEKEYYTERVVRKYDSLIPKNFSGAVLVAKNGEILLEKYAGYIDQRTKDSISPTTPFHIASVSKTFTGTAILKLWEENKLSLDDSIQRFFPGFPYRDITIRNMLNHRSGLPNYVYTMTIDTPWKKPKHFATNEDMLQFLMTHKPGIMAYPNRGFHYCNTNFALLALIIERVSGQSYPEYMKNNIFLPLGMKNSFVFSIKDTNTYKTSYNFNNRTFPLENMDCIYGDKNIYSTPRDLLLWDKAFYTNSIISKGTYEEATQPNSNERPSIHNYGLGFRLMMLPDYKIVYHNGWWHGNNAVFSRLVPDTATVIILGNKFNKAIYRCFKIGLAFTDKVQPQKKED